MEMGPRRTWKVLVPIMLAVSVPLTYEFMPWMIATTTIRKATETRMPRRVKNDRSLLVQIAWTARRRASVRGMP